MVECSEGHYIAEGQQTCPEGHEPAQQRPPSDPPPPPADPPTQMPTDLVAMMLQMQLMMQQTMQQMLALQPQTASPPQQPPQVPTPTLVKFPDQPTIEADSSDIDWAMFTDSWTCYKAMAKITTLTDTCNEL